MLAASLLALVLIASSLTLVSVLCARVKQRNGALKLGDASIQRASIGSKEKVEIVELNCNRAFQSLTAKQRKYAHYATRAFFKRNLAVYFQISTEAAGVFIMLYRLFSTESMERLRNLAEACKFTEDEWKDFIVWSALRLSCYANNFPHSKVPAPRVYERKLEKLLASSAGASDFPGTRRFYDLIFLDIFDANVIPAPASLSENVQKFIENTHQQFYMSLKTAKLEHHSIRICDGNGSFTDPKSRIGYAYFSMYPPVSMGSCHIFHNLLIGEPNMLTLKEEDRLLIGEYRGRGTMIQATLHEIGHGSGKLFTRSSDGVFNFDKENTVNILTGGRVASSYDPGETYASVFGDLAKAFEECRAEAVGYLLSCDMEVLKLFGYTGDSAEKIKCSNCLEMANFGLDSLLEYDVFAKKWCSKGGHGWARFVLLKVLLEAGEGHLSIEQTNSNGDGLLIHLDRTKIDSVGVPAIREFLKKLQVFKSTADVKGARALFDRYSVGPTEEKWREILCATTRGLPIVMLQPNTVMNAEGGVELKRYPVSAEGFIQSVVERYTIETIDEFEKLWRVEMDISAFEDEYDAVRNRFNDS